MKILGIDPGKNGGIAVVENNELVATYKTPKTEKAFVDLLRQWEGQVKLCVIERTTGFIGKWQPGARMFTFGWWTGGPVFAAHALGFPVKLVMAHKWQKDLQLLKKEDAEKLHDALSKKLPPKDRVKFDWKKYLRAEARDTWGTENIHLQVADAVLIATWGLRHVINK